MSKLDHDLREAVTQEDLEFLAQLDKEPGTMQQVAGIFRGPLSLLFQFFLLFAVAAGLFGVYAGWRFLTSVELRPLFYWGAATALCLALISVVRLLLFMRMNTNRILLELKRIELQIARQAAKREA